MSVVLIIAALDGFILSSFDDPSSIYSIQTRRSINTNHFIFINEVMFYDVRMVYQNRTRSPIAEIPPLNSWGSSCPLHVAISIQSTHVKNRRDSVGDRNK